MLSKAHHSIRPKYIEPNGCLLPSVAYPGGFSGCPETPPPDRYFDLNQGVIPFTGTVLHQPLQFATFGNPPKTNSGYATGPEKEDHRYHHTGPGNTGKNYEMGGTILSKTVKEKDFQE